MYVCICMYVCMNVCMYVYMYIYIYIYIILGHHFMFFSDRDLHSFRVGVCLLGGANRTIVYTSRFVRVMLAQGPC